MTPGAVSNPLAKRHPPSIYSERSKRRECRAVYWGLALSRVFGRMRRDSARSSVRVRTWGGLLLAELVEEHYAEAEKITLVMDNLNTHTPASLYERFKPERAKRILDRLEIHYTPEHGSWLNIAEIELSVLGRQCLGRRIGEKATLVKEVAAWQQRRNGKRAGVSWRFTTADARIKLKRLYPSIDT